MKPLSLEPIKPLDLPLKNQQPFSASYQDVYFSAQDGLAESRYVFIEQSQLTQRWSQTRHQAHFCIAETGFGTGLNFLATVDAWQKSKHKPRQLWFVSVEQHPLSPHSLELAHRCFPQLAPLAQRLQRLWGNFRPGMQCLEFGYGVKLLLILADAQAGFDQLQATVDAWYLDGFAPSKNPDMWQEPLYAMMAKLSKPGTTVATFTAASAVRKGLTKHGFNVSKQCGFGRKREMITASFAGSLSPNPSPHSPFWAPMPAAIQRASQRAPAVTILGGGIAGLCVAEAMHQLGWHTTVIDREAKPMTQASGNALAMVMPLVTAGVSPEALFYWRAFDWASRHYQATELHPIGVRQELLDVQSQQWAKRLAALQLPPSLVQVQADHVWYPGAGFVDTQQVANRLVGTVNQWLTATAEQIKTTSDGQWVLLDAAGHPIHTCEVLVLANGMGAKSMQPDWFDHLQARHGQTSLIKTPPEAKLDHVLLGQGYVIPTQQGRYWVCGATYDHVNDEALKQPAVLADDHWSRNLAWWQNHPIHPSLQGAQLLDGHAALRATTPDHLPLCGPVVDAAAFSQQNADLHHGRHWQSQPTAPTLNNLYVINGLGSRGFTAAPILAQVLAAMMTHQPLPLETDLCKMIHPNRFLYRTLKQPPNNR